MRKLRRKPAGRARASYAAVASELNTRGCPSRTGKPWRGYTVEQILSRPSEC
jgi:Recombinase